MKIHRKNIDQIFSVRQNPLIMGIINLDSSSFYKESIAHSAQQALQMVDLKLEEGMDILDLGAFSSRPGSKIPDQETEMTKILPVIAQIRKNFPELLISVDTMRSNVAKNCLEEGADIINDISGGIFDDKLPILMAQTQSIYIIMHMNGLPENMQNKENTNYENVVEDLLDHFQMKISRFKAIGLHKLVIDPGFGFSKLLSDNYKLLKDLGLFRIFEKPILAGISRKSMIWKVCQTNVSDALIGSLVAAFYAVQNSCTILRVHDVKETAQMLSVFQAIENPLGISKTQF